MKHIVRLFFVLIYFLIAAMGFSQKNNSAVTENIKYLPLPIGYMSIELGMSLEAVEQQLFADQEFLYRGAPEVTMLPQGKRKLIDCEGRFYIQHAYFQFNNEKLYVITLVFNTENLDYFSIYEALTKKYGPSNYLDPSKTVWENDKVELILERPLTVKYIDKKVFDDIKENSKIEESNQTKDRIDFISNF